MHGLDRRAVIAGMALAGLASPSHAEEPVAPDPEDIQGAGSTFVAPILAKWADDYVKSTGTKIAYLGGGSGAGIAKIKAGEIDFGATDKPLSSDELARSGLIQFPIVIGG